MRFTSRSALARQIDDRRGIDAEFDPTHQPRAPYLDDDRVLESERSKTPFQVIADRAHVIEQAALHQFFEEERRGASREQVATVGGAVVAGRDRLRNFLRDQSGADRYARAQRLSD